MLKVYASFSNKEDAIKFGVKRASHENRWLALQLIGENWIVSDYHSEHWQGWHYEQIILRVGKHFVFTPTEILNPLEVPVVFEDAADNIFYEGNAKDQIRLASLGRGIYPILHEHIIGTLVFAPGPEITEDHEDWSLRDIVNMRQLEYGN